MATMRVNIEESVFDHIPRLAKEMGWDFDRALGKLARVYRATQDAGAYEETQCRLVTICALIFDSDAEAEQFLWAMVTARLSVLLTDNKMRIRGNEDRIRELAEWYKGKVNGGKSRAKSANRTNLGKFKKLNDQSSSPPAAAGEIIQHGTSTASNQPGVLCPLSFVLSPNTNTEENTKILDLVVPPQETAEATPKKRRGRSLAEQERARRIKFAFLGGYRNFYGKDCERWGAPENSHVYHLLMSSTVEVLEAKAAQYFLWPNKRAIDAGHPFMKHPGSFSANLSEIIADESAPQRRKMSAIVAERMRLADHSTNQQDQAARVAAQIIGATSVGQQTIDFAQTRGSARSHDENHAALRDVHAQAIGSGDEDMG